MIRSQKSTRRDGVVLRAGCLLPTADCRLIRAERRRERRGRRGPRRCGAHRAIAAARRSAQSFREQGLLHLQRQRQRVAEHVAHLARAAFRRRRVPGVVAARARPPRTAGGPLRPVRARSCREHFRSRWGRISAISSARAMRYRRSVGTSSTIRTPGQPAEPQVEAAVRQLLVPRHPAEARDRLDRRAAVVVLFPAGLQQDERDEADRWRGRRLISCRYRGSKMCSPWTTCGNRTRFGSGNSRAVPAKSARSVESSVMTSLPVSG